MFVGVLLLTVCSAFNPLHADILCVFSHRICSGYSIVVFPVCIDTPVGEQLFLRSSHLSSVSLVSINPHIHLICVFGLLWCPRLTGV